MRCSQDVPGRRQSTEKAQRHGSMLKWANSTCPVGLNETRGVKDVAGWDASAPPAAAAIGTLVYLRRLWYWILQERGA